MTRDAPTVAVQLSRGDGPPLAVQLATQVRGLVAAGTLTAGTRLPSTRALAAELRVSRSVVEQAYDQLVAEGWVQAKRGAGTFVTKLWAHPMDRLGSAERLVPATAARRDPELHRHRSAPIRLDTGTPYVDERQPESWRRAWRDVAAARMPAGYPDPAGLWELRTQVASYVARRRGFACSPDQVLVTNGTTHALTLLLDVLPAGAVAVEDPGYRAAAEIVRCAGRDLVDVPLDQDGIDVAALRAVPAPVAAVYVTPAHQHPLGVTMPVNRRLVLLEEMRRRGAYVIEDDYDSEFRYDVAPMPALAGLDPERVAYLGTASKMLQPGLRIGWLVADPALIEHIAERRAARHDHPSWPVQRALVTMLREGYVDRLVRAARRVYAERGRLVVQRLAGHGDLQASPAGMYLTVRLAPAVADAVVTEARAAGIELSSLREYCRTASCSGIVIGYGGPTDAELAHALGVIADSLSRHQGPT
ncbi:MAG: PLP-dependent aminotransferase family protein [Nocardioidaceae bacterium]